MNECIRHKGSIFLREKPPAITQCIIIKQSPLVMRMTLLQQLYDFYVLINLLLELSLFLVYILPRMHWVKKINSKL